MARPTTARRTGTIKKLTSRGFCFLRYDSGEIFFHATALQPPLSWNDLQEGDAVSFTIGQSPKGARAEDVTRDEA